MSDLSERFVKHATEKDHLGHIIGRGDFENSEKEFPGICNQVKQCGDLTKFMINSGVRFFQGRTWADIDQAMMETGDFLKDRMAPYLQACLAKGLLVGERREEFAGLSVEETNQKIATDGFTEGCTAIFEEKVRDDEDLAKEMADMVVAQLGKFVNHSGLHRHKGKELAHIWEAWKFVLTGTGSALFVYGINIGAELKVDHQFSELTALIGSLEG
jgi:hypothetical protein